MATERDFVNTETVILGKFLEPAGEKLVGWVRTYECECGFRCRGSREIFNHVLGCRQLMYRISEWDEEALVQEFMDAELKFKGEASLKREAEFLHLAAAYSGRQERMSLPVEDAH